MTKTLAMKVLEGQKIAYDVVAYPSELRDAVAVAGELGVPAAQLFKTLVVTRAPARPALVLLPADRQLDLKKLARALGAKKLKMAGHDEAERLTGLQVGGISALALLNKGFSVFVDASIGQHDVVYISAGRRGLNLKLAAEDLLAVTGARVVDASRSGETD